MVDEVDTGLYHAVLPDVWKLVGAAAREFDVQVFATTHSWECVTAAYEAFADDHPQEFSVHRLERVNGTVEHKALSCDRVGSMIESGYGVR